MKTRGFFKKAVAAAAVGSMLVSGASTAWAGEFSDWAKTKLAENTAVVADSWDQSLEEANQGSKGYLDAALHLGETGRAMASMFLSGYGLDISWLENLGIKVDFSYEEGSEAAILNLYANDQSLLNMLMDIDLSGNMIRMMVPELSDSAIETPFEMNYDDEQSEQFFTVYKDAMKDPKAVLPSGDAIKELYDRYAGIAFDHMEDGTIEDTTVTAGGVSEAGKVYEGIADGAAILDMTKELLTTAKDDEQIKEVLDKVDATSEDLSGTFEKMQSGIDELLEDLSDEEAPDMSLVYRFYENADGKLIGVSYQIDAEDTQMQVDLLQPTEGEKSGLAINLSVPDTNVALEGVGSVADGIVNGEYQILYNGDAMAAATVADLDTNTWKAGTIDVTLNENKPDEETYQSVGAFTIRASFGEDAKSQNPYFDLAVLYAGSSLGSIRLSAGETDADIDVSALDAAANVYSTENKDDMNAFMGSVTVDTVLENLTAAGAPDGFAESLISLISGSGEDSSDYEYDDSDYADDSYGDYADGAEDLTEEDAAA